jgi:hypothetical protein
VRKIALPGIGAVLSARRKLIAPGQLGAVEAAARSELPLRFGRQVLSRPFRVGQGVRISHMDDGMIVQPVDVALRPIGMPPIRVLQIAPPLAEVSQVDRTIWRRENQRAGIEHMRQRAGIFFWIGRNFGKGDVPGGADEFLKLPVGHRRAIDPEAIDSDTMNRHFFRIVFIRSHTEGAAWNPDHIRRRRLVRPVD